MLVLLAFTFTLWSNLQQFCYLREVKKKKGRGIRNRDVDSHLEMISCFAYRWKNCLFNLTEKKGKKKRKKNKKRDLKRNEMGGKRFSLFFLSPFYSKNTLQNAICVFCLLLLFYFFLSHNVMSISFDIQSSFLSASVLEHAFYNLLWSFNIRAHASRANREEKMMRYGKLNSLLIPSRR